MLVMISFTYCFSESFSNDRGDNVVTLLKEKPWRDPLCGYWVGDSTIQLQVGNVVVTTVTGEDLGPLYTWNNTDRWNFDRENTSAYLYEIRLDLLSYDKPVSEKEISLVTQLMDSHRIEFYHCFSIEDRKNDCDPFQCPEFFDLVVSEVRQRLKGASILDIHIEPQFIYIDF